MPTFSNKSLPFSKSSQILHTFMISYLRAKCPLQLILLYFIIPSKTMACQPLSFSIYIIGLYREEKIKTAHFVHDLKIPSQSPKIATYVVMLLSHTDTLNTAIQYCIFDIFLSAAQLPCHQMLLHQLQFITPQLEFSHRTIHMGFQMDTVTFGHVFLRALRVLPCQLPFHQYSTLIHLSLDDGQWVHYRPHFHREPHPTTRK